MDSATPPHTAEPPRRRGRPSRLGLSAEQSREQLIRAGVALLTERGISATSLDDVLSLTGLPKGSFYHHFGSKEAWLSEAIAAYGRYFEAKLQRHFSQTGLPPARRIALFVDDACAGMARHGFRRGCLVGNLGQEVALLSPQHRLQLEATFQRWEALLARCLTEQPLPPLQAQALAHAFWIGWEGAILRARLCQTDEPLRRFHHLFAAALPAA